MARFICRGACDISSRDRGSVLVIRANINDPQDTIFSLENLRYVEGAELRDEGYVEIE